MRRTDVSFSGAVDLNAFDLPAAVRSYKRGPLISGKQTYALGEIPQRNVSPVFDNSNRPRNLTTYREDSDLLPIKEQPKPYRGVRTVIASPPPDGQQTIRRALIRAQPLMNGPNVQEDEKESLESTHRGYSFPVAGITAAAKLKKLASKHTKAGLTEPEQGKVMVATETWPGPDDHCANSCILWCCCCVGQTRWPPRKGCCPDTTCADIFCPCCSEWCRGKTCFSIFCPCCVECCGDWTCKKCCVSSGKRCRNEYCGICCDVTDDEEEEEEKKDEKSKKDEKAKTGGETK